MGELDDSFGELDQQASPPTCFYRKISTETPIETKGKAFQSEFKRERKEGALEGWSTFPFGELDGSNSPNEHFERVVRSNSPNGRVGRLIRSNSPNRRVGWFDLSNLSFDGTLMRSFRKCY